MSRPTIRTPQNVTLSANDWVAELTTELSRLHVPEPEDAAYRVLRHVVARAGYYSQFRVVTDPTVGVGSLAAKAGR